MECEILLFARLRDLTGTTRLTLDLPDTSTVADAIREVVARHPEIERYRTMMAVAVDEALAQASTPLHPGAVVALLPPVSGG